MPTTAPHAKVVRLRRPLEEIWQDGPPPPEILEDVYRHYIRYVMTIALRILGHEDDARDVAQDVFLRLQRHRRSIYGPEVLQGWLATTTVRRARRVLQIRHAKRWVGLDTEIDYHQLPAAGANPEEKALLQKVFRALEGFPIEERLAWSLRHIQGEKLADVAEMTGCSLATAKRRIARAQERLEEMLDDD